MNAGQEREQDRRARTLTALLRPEIMPGGVLTLGVSRAWSRLAMAAGVEAEAGYALDEAAVTAQALGRLPSSGLAGRVFAREAGWLETGFGGRAPRLPVEALSIELRARRRTPWLVDAARLIESAPPERLAGLYLMAPSAHIAAVLAGLSGVVAEAGADLIWTPQALAFQPASDPPELDPGGVTAWTGDGFLSAALAPDGSARRALSPAGQARHSSGSGSQR